MIEVKLTKSDDTIAIDFSGHAGYAKPGQDIVCAGVSALFYALAFGVNGLSPGAASVEGKTITVTRNTPEIRGAITAIFEGLRAIEREYPECVRVAGEHTPVGCERHSPTSLRR